MKRFLTAYAMRFHRRYGTHGHVFGARYKAILCDNDAYFLQLLRYIHLNPVKSELADDPAAWPHSGHRELIGMRGLGLVDQSFPLSFFAHRPRQEYQEFVSQGLTLMTQQGAVSALDAAVPVAGAPPPPVEVNRPSKTGCLEEFAKRHCSDNGISMAEMVSRSSRPLAEKARRELIVAAVDEGYPMAEIARYLRRGVPAICNILRRLGK